MSFLNDPIFEKFPDKFYSKDIINQLYAFSQQSSTKATLSFPEFKSNSTGETPELEIKGFRSIVPFALIRYLDRSSSILVSPTVRILGDSFTYDKGSTAYSINRIKNNSFVGITNFDSFREAYHAQGAKQAERNQTRRYTNIQSREVKYLENSRKSIYNKYKQFTRDATSELHTTEPNGLFQFPMYNLFSKETRADYIKKVSTLVKDEQFPQTILIIPLQFTPFNYSEPDFVIAHAQYILIHIPRKMYTIIDGQFDNSDQYRKLIQTELSQVDGLIEEIMGEKFEPYLYNVPCPQSVVKDKNCIWWSMLIMYLYIQSDPETVDYRLLLRKIQKLGEDDPSFMNLRKLLHSFKVFVMETVLQPMLHNQTLKWRDLSRFFRNYFPSSRSLEAVPPRVTDAIQNAIQQSMLPSGAVEDYIRQPGPARIGQPPKTMGGRRTRKLKTGRHQIVRTHKRNHGKLIRKSSRR